MAGVSTDQTLRGDVHFGGESADAPLTDGSIGVVIYSTVLISMPQKLYRP